MLSIGKVVYKSSLGVGLVLYFHYSYIMLIHRFNDCEEDEEESLDQGAQRKKIIKMGCF